MESRICYNSVISLLGWRFYGNRTEDQSRQAETAHEPDGICAAFRREFCYRQQMGEWQDDAQLPRPAYL